MGTKKSELSKEIKSSKSIKFVVFILILAFYGSLLAHQIELPFGDDLARHIENGQLIMHGHFEVLYANVYAYTEAEFPFVNHHWLSGVVFCLVQQAAGWGGLVIFKIIILLVVFSVLFLTALRKADYWLVAFFSIPTIVLLSERTALRPEIFSYLFVTLFLYLLTDLEEHPDRKRVFWLIPLQLCWVNMHIFFVVGIMLVGGFLFEKLIVYRHELKSSLLVRKLFILFVSLICISFINPNGWHGAVEPFKIFSNYGMAVSENESMPQFLRTIPTWYDPAIVIFWPTAFLLALSFFFALKRKPRQLSVENVTGTPERALIFYFFAAAGTAVMGFSVLRMLPFFGLIFLPAASANFNNLFCDSKAQLRQMSPRVAALCGRVLVVLLILVLTVGVVMGSQKKLLTHTKSGIGLLPHAEDAGLFMRDHALTGPVFNDYDSGSYLLYYLFPQEKVFVDNRPEAYPAAFFTETYLPMLETEETWQKMLQRYDFNVIFFDQYDKGSSVRPFLYRRLRDPAWSLVYADAYNVIFLRDTPKNQDTIKQFQITPENAPEKLAHLMNSQNLDEEVAAADVFNLLGRVDLGVATFVNILARWPDQGRVWMIMGEEWQQVYDDPRSTLLSAMYLDKAITLGWDTAESYSFLGAAYIKLGQSENAKEALFTALKRDPERQDAKNLLMQLEKSAAQGEK